MLGKYVIHFLEECFACIPDCRGREIGEFLLPLGGDFGGIPPVTITSSVLDEPNPRPLGQRAVEERVDLLRVLHRPQCQVIVDNGHDLAGIALLQLLPVAYVPNHVPAVHLCLSDHTAARIMRSCATVEVPAGQNHGSRVPNEVNDAQIPLPLQEIPHTVHGRTHSLGTA